MKAEQTSDWNPMTVEIAVVVVQARLAQLAQNEPSRATIRIKAVRRPIIGFNEALCFPLIDSKFLAKV